MGKRSTVYDDQGNPVGVREVSDDGTTSILYEYDDSFAAHYTDDYRGQPVEIADHYNGKTVAYEYNRGLFAAITGTTRGLRKGEEDRSSSGGHSIDSLGSEDTEADDENDREESGESDFYVGSTTANRDFIEELIKVFLIILVLLGAVCLVDLNSYLKKQSRSTAEESRDVRYLPPAGETGRAYAYNKTSEDRLVGSWSDGGDCIRISKNGASFRVEAFWCDASENYSVEDAVFVDGVLRGTSKGVFIRSLDDNHIQGSYYFSAPDGVVVREGVTLYRETWK